MDGSGFGGMLKKVRYLESEQHLSSYRWAIPKCRLILVTPMCLEVSVVQGQLWVHVQAFSITCTTRLMGSRRGVTRSRLLVAPTAIHTEVIEGFRAIEALAEDQGLRELDELGEDETPDYRKTSRPFGPNCGFTMGESSQYIILMNDQLAIELGATIYGRCRLWRSHADGGEAQYFGSRGPVTI